ncbi:pali-domain-containing protein [Trametes versicolor FP-101664 SS1]|uniref:pali-domain-containing protein n=1 Tax=Trametes versicolor (strain FP-101664) TaxID=717944 RepID=UPI00046242FC|nr:pali-domain-containing protein [Trametes versicolor FP-101664 SS1]EIW63101.1 pali-domain-containing protein [Trametes versicolor FP-101664 SS1]
MAAGAAVPGLFFAFAAMVLLIFASISSPTWERISYLDVPTGATTTHFGVFGYTGTKAHVGWFFPGTLADSRLNGHLFHNLTSVLILIPIAAGLSGLSVLFGLCGAAYHRAGTVFMTLLSALAFLVTLVAWVIEMVLFGVARNHFRDRGIDAKWGNANWIVLGALVALFLAFFASLCGSFGRYSYGRKRAVAAY